MKKLAKLLACVAMLAIVAAPSAMAFEESGSGELEFTGPNLKVGLSPKVWGIYFTNGASTQTAQWYAIGAVHPGGNEMYSTAQDLTNTYKKAFTAGTTIDSALFGLPATPESAETWVANGWNP